MVGLTFSNLKKRDNFSRFKQRILDSKTFEIVDSKKSFYRTDTVVISQDEDLVLAFRRAEEDPIFAHFQKWAIGNQLILPICSSSGISLKTINSGHLLKTRDFGRRHTEDLYSRENSELNSLRREIGRLTVSGAYPISIMVRSCSNNVSWIHDVVDARISLDLRGNPGKSDFNLVNSKGEIICKISHKYGDNPRDFRQWSGTRDVLLNKEVVYFGEQLKAELDMLSLFEDGTPGFPSYTFGKQINSDALKRYALFGNNEIDLVIQGNISFSSCSISDTFSNSFSIASVALVAPLVIHKDDSVDSIPDGYQPTLVAFTGCDRAAFGIQGCRLAIYPKGGRKITKDIR